MNKKGQYYPQPEPDAGPFANVNPILIVGIVVFILPFFNAVLGWNLPKWINGIGIILILIGALLSMLKIFNR